jgi:protease I
MEVHIASFRKGKIRGKHGYEVTADKSLNEINSEDYDILILAGGRAPDKIRKESDALRISREFFQQEKPVAAICHGAQTLISAGLLKGRRATCYSSVAGELKEAGASYEDREVVVDRNLVTSRLPSDLPSFLREIMKKIKA